MLVFCVVCVMCSVLCGLCVYVACVCSVCGALCFVCGALCVVFRVCVCVCVCLCCVECVGKMIVSSDPLVRMTKATQNNVPE